MWCEFPTIKRTLKPNIPTRDFYAQLLANAAGHPDAITQFSLEARFHEDKTPYYCVHAGVANSLAKITLDVDSTLFTLPLPTIELRFKQPSWHGIKSILAGEVKIKDQKGIALFVDTGEFSGGLPLTIYTVFKVIEGKTVAELKGEVPLKHHLSKEEQKTMTRAVQITLAASLLSREDPLVSPDVLTADRQRLTEENAERLAERARQRGKYGWILGDEGSSVSPHYRCSHFRWLRVGRDVPKLVSVRAAIVHRSKVENVPTGFGDGG